VAGKTIRFFEGLVILAILLVLVQTFLEDLALVLGWSWPVRRGLIVAGFGFDLFFTFEFLIRFYAALSRRRAARYFLHERGWIDLLASVPLLLFNSGPAVAAIYFGGGAAGVLGGILNVLKVTKAIRITRILRLLRVLKVFGRIRYAESRMAQRHAAKVTTVAVTVMVLVPFLWTAAEGALRLNTTEELLAGQREAKVQRLAEAEPSGEMQRIAGEMPDLLLIKRGEETLYSRLSNAEYRRLFGPEDYTVLHRDGRRYFFSLLPQRAEYAGTNMLLFLMIVGVVLAILLYYAPHFALTVTDPIHIMRRGFAEPSYKLEVRIPRKYSEDDIYRLARLYNEHYLPMKERAQSIENERRSTDLSLEDLKDLNDEFGKQE
jgi:hypothetical protein